MDIIGAIEKEKEYLAFRAKDEEPYHLVDAVKEYGFGSLDEYFEAKRDYKFDSLSFDYIEEPCMNALKMVFQIMEEKKTCLATADSDRTFVFNGQAGATTFNSEYCTENNIPVFHIETIGGTIVCSDGDLSIAICCPEDTAVNARFILSRIKRILQKHTSSIITVDRNDLLVDGKKVLGSSIYHQNDMFMFVGHVSFSDKAQLIETICTTNKVGKDIGYIDFIGRDIFKQEVAKWLKVHSY